MNTNKLGLVRRATGMSGIVLAATLTAPSVAFAASADILIPKPAEFIPALIAFVAIWLILAKMAWPMIIKTLDAREEKIASDIKAAEDAKQKAERDARAQEEQIAAANREAADIIAAAKREGEEERSKIIAEAQASAVAIIAKAHDAIDSERKKAMVELSGQVVDLSVEIASKIIGDALDDQEQHHLAEKYLLEVGDLNEE
ncbi:MAG: F0F1 ATP synthase subunit B [Coriobacteriales bacterium]|nr:F0F1 ATP synthase subunit B [Coriobacteriales bacterium]